MRRGRQNYELKVFGSKNLPKVGQFNVQWRRKNVWGYKKLQGRQKAYKGGGGQKSHKGSPKKVATFFVFGDSKNFVGAPKVLAGARQMVNMVNVTPLIVNIIDYRNIANQKSAQLETSEYCK